MELKVYWTLFAESKLEDIFEYYKINVDIKVAKKITNGILDTTSKLTKKPFIGQIEDLLSGRTLVFRYIVYQNYKIIYLVNEVKNHVLILNVFDTRQSPLKINLF
jgi:toxin ParE1/3/4